MQALIDQTNPNAMQESGTAWYNPYMYMYIDWEMWAVLCLS
jgi:hypothetical protein